MAKRSPEPKTRRARVIKWEGRRTRLDRRTGMEGAGGLGLRQNCSVACQGDARSQRHWVGRDATHKEEYLSNCIMAELIWGDWCSFGTYKRLPVFDQAAELESQLKELTGVQGESRLLMGEMAPFVQSWLQSIAAAKVLLGLTDYATREMSPLEELMRQQRMQELDSHYSLSKWRGERQQLELQMFLKHAIEKYGGILTSGELEAILAAFDASVRLSDNVVSTVPGCSTTFGGQRQQLEIQTLLKHAIKKYGDILAPRVLDAISEAFDLSVRLSNMVVMALPDWFATSAKEWTGAVTSSLEGGEEIYLREVSVWAELQHPNVRKFYGACHVSKDPFVIHERSWPFDEHGVFTWNWRGFLGVARGILYIHERGLVHHHLATCHLLKRVETAKLSGLGLTWCSTVNKLRHQGCDSQQPAIEHKTLKTESQQPSRTADVVAFGMAIFNQLMRHRLKFTSSNSLHVSEASRLPHSQPEFLSENEWRLLQGMCAANSAERISMLDVVHQMAALANQEESPTKPELPPLKRQHLETLVDVRQYIIPSLNETTEAVLRRAIELCAAADPELADLYRPVLKRLENIYHQVLELPTFPPLRLVESLTILLERWFCPLERNASFCLSQNSVSPLCASRTIAGRNYGLHHDLDGLLRDFSDDGLDSSADVHQWQPSWKKICRRQRQTLETLVEDPSSILEGMKDDTDRSEALALLYSEARRTGLRVGRLPDLPVWFIPPHLVQLGKHLATGSFGAVYEGMYLDTPVVVKQVLTTGLGVEERQQFRQEADLWFSLKHPYLINLYGACHEGRPFFVCERAMGGTIVEVARKDPFFIWGFLVDAAWGLQHLHDHGIVHGDLKGNNILIGEDSQAKLADFGLSFAINQPEMTNAVDGGALGAYRWKAPEVLMGGKATFESDIYSFGMCIIETVTGEFPWGNSMSDAVVTYNVVERRLLPRRPSEFRDEQWELVRRMCCYEPEERLKAGDVVKRIVQNGL